MTLPSAVTVLLDDGTGTFPYDISSKVLSQSGFNYSRGRADWQGGVTAGQLSLTLNNSDGRFTRGSTLIASPSPIRVDQRIRIKETVGGTTFTRFTGYVKSWPVQWPATVTSFATATITVTDAQARAERRVLLSVVEEEILSDSPDAYFTLGEPVGATTAADSSGNQASPLTMDGTGTAVVFGVASGVTTTPLTVAQFSAGKYLKGASAPLGPTAQEIVIHVTFSTSTAALSTIIGKQPDAGQVARLIGIDATGHLTSQIAGTSAAVVTDGLVHTADLVVGFSTTTLYLDGVSVASSATSPYPLSLNVGEGFTGLISHVAYWTPSGPSTSRLLEYKTALSTGLATEACETRITRLAGYANLPLGTLDTSTTSVPFADFIGTSAWDAIQTVVDAEGGVAFIDESGALEFHDRDRAPTKAVPDLTLAAGLYVTPDVQPVDDDQQILNYVETSSTATEVVQVVRDIVSELGDGTATNPGHGRYSDSKSYLVATDQEALDRANWIVDRFAEPTTRYGTLTINLYAMTPAMVATVLTAIDINCWLRVTGMASQNPDGTTVDVVVQGFTEEATANSWTLTCNVVALSIFRAWILENSTYGVLDTTTRLYI